MKTVALVSLLGPFVTAFTPVKLELYVEAG